MSTQFTESGNPIPPIPVGFQLPFYYSSLSNCEVLYLVDAEVARSYLINTNLNLAIFDGRGCASFNYQLYSGQFPTGENVTQEIELNIVAYQASRAPNIAEVTFEQFIFGEEQTKLLGNHRVHVPCDDEIAIKAGKELFGEPKFKTTFTVNIPSLNDPKVKIWQFTCNDPHEPKSKDGYIFSCQADLRHLDLLPGNFTPITEYGTDQGKLIGARWDILEPFAVFLLNKEEQHRVEISYGLSNHPMRKDMELLIEQNPAAAVRVFQSRPVAIQSRAYYP